MWTEQELIDAGMDNAILWLNKFILLHEKNYDEIKASEKIKIVRNGIPPMEKQISIKLLLNIINDEEYYNRIMKAIKNSDNKNQFDIATIRNGQRFINSYSIIDIALALNKMVSDGKLVLNDEQNEKVKQINYQASEEKMLLDFKDKEHHVIVDGEELHIPIKNILALLYTDDEEYLQISKEITIYGMPIEKYIFIVHNFVEGNALFGLYNIAPKVIKRYVELTSFDFVDYEAVNKMMKKDELYIKNVSVNPELERPILEAMPYDFDDTEKAIYIYIKMCKILTYDPEFYAFDKRGKVAAKHNNMKMVNAITHENNNVVCYEFNAIYAKMLDRLGINFQATVGYTDEFDDGHAYLEFRSGKFLVKADSTIGVLNNDMTRVKLNMSLSGLICLNQNDKTRKELDGIILKIYDYVIKEQSEKKNSFLKDQNVLFSFEQALSEYRHLRKDDGISIDIAKKLDTLIDSIHTPRKENFKRMDALSYATILKGAIFSREERSKNICMTIIRKNIDDNYSAVPIIVFTVNGDDFHRMEEENLYFIYDPTFDNKDYDITRISRDDLIQKFEIREYEYLREQGICDCRTIPGIMKGRML